MVGNVFVYELWRVPAQTFQIKIDFGKSAGFSK
jgi:hypothetical protein